MGFFSSIGGILGSATGNPIIGAIGGAVGGAIDSKGASDAAAGAARGAAQARADVIASAKLEVDTAKSQLDRFESIYGNIEKNLGTFFNTLTPERIETIDLQNNQQEFQKLREEINVNFEQRGLGKSGLAADAEKELEIRNAENRAEIRSSAPIKTAQAQQEFLRLGLGQGESARNRLAAAERGRTANLVGIASDATIAAQNAATDAGSVIGDFLASPDLAKSAEVITGGIRKVFGS